MCRIMVLFLTSCSTPNLVARRKEEHLEHNDPNDSDQSAYRTGHSTETVLLKLHTVALYEGSMTALIILDLSASFGVIDLPIL